MSLLRSPFSGSPTARRRGLGLVVLCWLSLVVAAGCAEIVGFGDHELEPSCGNGSIAAGEECDDRNALSGDGCSAACSVEEGFTCVGEPSQCTPVCGDGLLRGAEGCDDKDVIAGDGCSSKCSVEEGYLCSGEPSDCKTVCGDGTVAKSEECDDHNTATGDGCSAVCSVEMGFTCGGSPSMCAEICGDGLVVGDESCDDKGLVSGDGCSSVCNQEAGYWCAGEPSTCDEVCGDGFVVGGEGCDDKNVASNDGCSATCEKEEGFTCSGLPTKCVEICGDGLVVGGEGCDDANLISNDGCSSACQQEAGYLCDGAPSMCAPICGDGLLRGGEACDDKNALSADGCSATCEKEAGFLCFGEPSQCSAVCGDGLVVGSEGCDDQNTLPNDGCGSMCTVELGYFCAGEPSACAPICGDGLLRGGEACDDKNTASLDGCSASCQKEEGYSCAGEPSVCSSSCGDGVLAVGTEECDDGATLPGDCCSAACKLEAVGCEVEPNNTSPKANDFAALSVGGAMKAALTPSSDIDIFRLTVPPFGVGDILAQTVDGPFGSTCASNAIDTVIAIRNSVGSILASDDDAGIGFCSSASAFGLPPGDYFVEVTAAAPISFDYGLALSFNVALCGNGAKEGLEQCDDGNTMSGDGCSPACLFEMESEDEGGGNNSCADTSGPYSPPVIIAGAITPQGDADYFAFTVPAVADVRVETFGSGGPGSCAAPIDTLVELRGQDCVTVIASDNDDGLGACSLIHPAVDVGARHLAPGTYYLRVEELGNNAEILPGYTAHVTFAALCGDGVKEGSEECDGASLPSATCDASCERIPVCGDMFVDAPETCDDGNVTSGDGCDSACELEGVGSEVEPNGTLAEAMNAPISITGDAYVTGSVGVIGDKDLFKLVLSQAAVVRLETFDSSLIDCAGISTSLSLLSAGGVQLYANDSSGIGSCSALVVRLSPGTYYAQVEELGNNATIPGYALEVDFQAEIGSEVEGNDTLMNATPMAGSDVVILGSHQVNVDADHFAVTVPEGWSIRAEVIEGSLAETCESNGIDSELALLNAVGTIVASADDGGRGFCSMLDGTGTAPFNSGAHGLAAGTYYLRVKASAFAQMGAAGQFDYRLAVTLRAP